MNATEYEKFLRSLGACREARDWSRNYGAQEAWDACEDGRWMLWLAGRLSGDRESDTRRALVLCACECARLALKHVKPGEERPLRAIETAECWARREEGVTIEQVRAAAAYADAAAYAAAAYAAYAAAAYAADDAAYAAAAASAAAGVAARKKTLAECAAIVRRHYPISPALAGQTASVS